MYYTGIQNCKMSHLQNRGIAAFLDAAVGVSAPAASTGSFGGLVVDGNTAATTIATGGTWVDLNLDLIAILSTNTVDWIVSDQATGELEYQGSETFEGLLLMVLTMTGSAALDFSFRAVKNGSPITPENARADNRVSTTPQTISLLTPLTMSSGDTVRLQVTTFPSTNGDAEITDISMQAWPIA